MDARTKAKKVVSLLQTQYPEFSTILEWKEPWQLLIAVVLSAQTTDEVVNKVTHKLFAKYPTIQEIGNADIGQLEHIVYQTGYYRAKARNVQKLCRVLQTEHNCNVPKTMQELIALPGVGRKTGNVILHILYDKAEGIVMDTHIARVTHRLGFTKQKDPKKGEEKMMRVLPKKEWKQWGDLLIQHGRAVCSARKPNCSACVLNELCPSSLA